MTNKELGLKKVLALVERFKEHQIIYKKAEYNETQTRRDFIDPFFKALGWDIDNELGFAESYREVIHEDKIKISGGTKAPDYSFRLSGQEKLFFLEAKKPNVNIKDHIDPSYQIKRYGWNAKMTISVLTDFEELSIYDCTKEPNSTDTPAKARLHYTTYEKYEEEWDFLWSVLSKEAAQNGGFSDYLKKVPQKKGADTVDKKFLKSLDEWRTLLAETISKENKQLDEDELNYVVQQTLDRIIFLRICEDRSIEPYGTLKECLNSGDFYNNLLLEFKQADDKYNSGLFNFKKDKLSNQLKINNKTLKTIISQLYYPECPYEFSVLSVEILGNAYEQFLGKTITINNKGKALIELKPEVRKAGGVYYTPQYIVDYIVTNTVGKLCEKKTPTQVAEIKIVDPACGSGSFLIGAYQYLLNWHKDYYLQNPNKKNPLTPEGNLTTPEKKKILLNNIYGVDIDVNAVEVTKLSLLLKCMEGETQASIAHQMRMFSERVLPTLDDNIKSGNSLIDTDYYDTQFDFGEERIIKPFSWQKAYPTIFKNGGFDVVVGNPPYVDSRINEESSKNYWKNHYKSSKYGKTNTYEIFIERGMQLLKKEGKLGYIIPIVLLNVSACKGLREVLINDYTISEISYTEFNVFENANVDTMILLLKNVSPNVKDVITVNKFSNLFKEVINENILNQFNLKEIDEYKISIKSTLINSKIKDKITVIKISDELDFYNGIATGPDKEKYFSLQKINTNYKPLLMGNNIGALLINYDGKYINYDRKLLHRAREEKIFLADEKIIMQRIRNLKLDRRLVCTIDRDKFYTFNSVNNLLLKANSNYKLSYFLGLLNSNLLNYLFKLNSLNTNITLSDLDLIPMKKIDFSNKQEVQAHDQIVNFVEQLLQLKKDLTIATLETKKEQIKSKIEYNEDKINSLVYQLYDLKKEEIELIESN
jgi:hypothetical protein